MGARACRRGASYVVLFPYRLSADRSEFRSGKASDIISTLVSIYDTREVIIKELQVLLGQRLLAVKDYDAVKEVSSHDRVMLTKDSNHRIAQTAFRRGYTASLRCHAQRHGRLEAYR